MAEQTRDTPTQRLIATMARLRGPDGCPWDKEQTLESLKKYLVEESYEVLDAIESGDVERHKEELGDLLLQIAFQSQIREEQGDFCFDDVADRIVQKLVHRHPHVFGDTRVKGTQDVLRNWETLKAAEKDKSAGTEPLGGIPRHLPALHKAHKIQTRAARVGFDWTEVHDVVAKIEEELREVKEALKLGDAEQLREELGDLLFAVVNLSRFRKISAEEALDRTVAKFARRFGDVERRVRQSGKQLADCDLAELDAHWEAVKLEEKSEEGSQKRV